MSKAENECESSFRGCPMVVVVCVLVVAEGMGYPSGDHSPGLSVPCVPVTHVHGFKTRYNHYLQLIFICEAYFKRQNQIFYDEVYTK